MPDTEIQTGKFTVQRLPSFAAASLASISGEVETSPPVSCANCGETLAGPYCAQCGQHVADYHRSVWRFVVDFLDNTFCWDNKLFRTLGPLVRQPGLLTREYMEGRRVRYVHPLRLFLFTSAVCLSLLQYTHNRASRLDRESKSGAHVTTVDSNPSETAAIPTPIGATASPAASVSPGTIKEDADEATEIPSSASDAVQRALAERHLMVGKDGRANTDELGNRITRMVKGKIAKAGGQDKFEEMIDNGVQQRLSWVALALLPVFALGLRAVYWRKDSYYFAHLVFSLHYHTFLLLLWTACTLAQVVASYLPLHRFLEGTLGLLMLLPPVYLYFALRRMYGGRPGWTFGKVMLLGSLHLLVIVSCVAGVGAYYFFSAPR